MIGEKDSDRCCTNKDGTERRARRMTLSLLPDFREAGSLFMYAAFSSLAGPPARLLELRGESG